MDTQETNGEPEKMPAGKYSPRRPARTFTDKFKASVLAELDECATRKESRAVLKRHNLQLHQVIRWREKAAGAPKAAKKPSKEPPGKPESISAVVYSLVLFLEGIEQRLAALEASQAKIDIIAKALGGG